MKRGFSILLGGLLLAGVAMIVVPSMAADLPKNLIPIIENTTASGRFDVYHWWTTGGEKEAINSALNVFEEHYPNIEGVSNAIPGGAGGAMVMKVKVLIVAGHSPDTFQAHPSFEIHPYTDSDMLYSLDDIWKYDNIEARLLPGIADMCKVGDDYYAAPIGIHRANVIWYNKHMFSEYGIEPPQEPVTWEEFWALCDELQAKLPEGKYPLALGDRKGWPGTQVFETIMMGTDPKIYEHFINGVATEEEVGQILTKFKKFLAYVPPDHTARLWYEAAARVYAGDYAMYLNGGWVKGYFNSRGWVPGKDYGAFLAPGTSNDFGLVVDSFVVPRGSSNAEMGIRWAHMCTDPDLQLAFTSLKGSISPYSDTPDSVYDPITLQFKKDLLNKDVLVYPSIAHGMALPWSTLMTLHSLISDFTSRSNPDVARHARNITQAVRESGIKEVWHFDF